MSCDILRYDEISRFHSEYYARNRPVIVRGIREAMPLKIFDWSAEFFVGVLGDTKVPVYKTRSGFLSYERDVVELPFSEFAARAFGPPGKRDPEHRSYYRNRVRTLPAEVDDSHRIEALAPYLRRAVISNLWISGTDTTVALHFDAADNLNFQLKGNKQFVLYPPGVRNYYPESMFSQTAHVSRVYRNGPTPDLKQFPRFDPSSGLHIEVLAGDVLYLPAYWWHQVHSCDAENVNLNFWWMPCLRKQVLNWNQALRGHFQVFARYLRFGDLNHPPPRQRGGGRPGGGQRSARLTLREGSSHAIA
jgi:hypothetical protein